MNEGQVVKHDFIFTNTGNATLELTAVKPSCGCTTPGTWDKKVEPGQTGKIPVEFNSKGFGGDTRKTIQVASNDPAQTNVTLEIKAHVWRPFDVVPSLAYFNFPPGSTERQTRVIKIKSNLEEPITLSEPVLTNQNFEAVLKTVTEGKEFELTVSTMPPQGPGNKNAVIELKTSSTNHPVIKLTASAYAQPALAVSPAQVTLPAGPLAKPVKSTITLRNQTTNSIAVTEPVLNIPGVEVALTEVQTGKVFTASLNFPEGFTAPPGQKLELTMKSTLADHETIRVPVVQMARPAPVQVRAPSRTQAPDPQRAALQNRMRFIVPTN